MNNAKLPTGCRGHTSSPDCFEEGPEWARLAQRLCAAFVSAATKGLVECRGGYIDDVIHVSAPGAVRQGEGMCRSGWQIIRSQAKPPRTVLLSFGSLQPELSLCAPPTVPLEVLGGLVVEYLAVPFDEGPEWARLAQRLSAAFVSAATKRPRGRQRWLHR